MGGGTSRWVPNSQDVDTTFDVPSSGVPVGTQYRICVHSNGLINMFTEGCRSYIHQNNNGEVLTAILNELN
jgi:hypothetical protein